MWKNFFEKTLKKIQKGTPLSKGASLFAGPAMYEALRLWVASLGLWVTSTSWPSTLAVHGAYDHT